jgi:hypothetical protein
LFVQEPDDTLQYIGYFVRHEEQTHSIGCQVCGYLLPKLINVWFVVLAQAADFLRVVKVMGDAVLIEDLPHVTL